MAPKAKKAQPLPVSSNKDPEPQTIGAKRRAEYLASRPLQVAFESKGWAGLTAAEKAAYANFRFLEDEVYKEWSVVQQKEFFKLVEAQKTPTPLPAPRSLGKDLRGRNIDDYTLEEYAVWQAEQNELYCLKDLSASFKRKFAKQRAREKEKERTKLWKGKKRDGNKVDLEALPQQEKEAGGLAVIEKEIQEERERRIKIASMQGTNIGRYEVDPLWDDVVPIPQDDGEKPLAPIAYTDEYAEAISYLRAIMAAKEYSPRALHLTKHIIELNPAHYTVWLYRAQILFALNADLYAELEWVDSISLDNQKNYQIRHHREILINHLSPTIGSRAGILSLARAELAFMAQMFAHDSKNYHIWSYRQYLTRKLSLFPSQCCPADGDPDELVNTEMLIEDDVRNNSAWAYRFFLVFSDPGHSTPGCRATERDPAIPDSIIKREIAFAKEKVILAPQNQSPWNYIRGVLRKGGGGLAALEEFAVRFVKLGDAVGQGEDVKSSHALGFLADVWAEMREWEKADKALALLAEKYDRIRSNYWEWRREGLGAMKEDGSITSSTAA